MKILFFINSLSLGFQRDLFRFTRFVKSKSKNKFFVRFSSSSSFLVKSKRSFIIGFRRCNEIFSCQFTEKIFERKWSRWINSNVLCDQSEYRSIEVLIRKKNFVFISLKDQRKKIKIIRKRLFDVSMRRIRKRNAIRTSRSSLKIDLIFHLKRIFVLERK